MKKKKPFDVRRGGVYMADLGSEEEVVGSEQAGVRLTVRMRNLRQSSWQSLRVRSKKKRWIVM